MGLGDRAAYNRPDLPKLAVGGASLGSEWEAEWPPFANRYGLPAYVANQTIGDCRPDIHFPDNGVVVEMDGWETHGTFAAFRADRELESRGVAGGGHLLKCGGYPTTLGGRSTCSSEWLDSDGWARTWSAG
jgi:hypothetical protein